MGGRWEVSAMGCGDDWGDWLACGFFCGPSTTTMAVIDL